MILSFKVKNYKTFSEEISVDFTASEQIKRFLCNTVECENKKILKAIGLYGPNNSGKTCFILSIANLANLMLNRPHEDLSNSFTDNNITEYEVEYEVDRRMYRYIVKYDCENKLYLYESLCQLTFAPSNKYSKTYTPLIIRENNHYQIKGLTNKQAETLSQILTNNYPVVQATNFIELKQSKDDYITFAKSILLLRLDGVIDMRETINLIQNNPKALNFIKCFVKNCDLHVDDFGTINETSYDSKMLKNLSADIANPDELKIFSKHHGKIVPSCIFDSVGTRKIITIAGYLYDAFTNNKILLIDEIDSSLHHILTRALVSLFNNSLNKKTQLIFTTHDLLLLDLQHLLRKDQIFLTDIDTDDITRIIPLSKFTTRDENGIRSEQDIKDHYLKGKFGGIPTPDLFECLEEVLDETK